MAFLYACMEDWYPYARLDQIKKKRGRIAYNELHLEPTQPVKKVSLLVRRREDQLLIDEVVEIGNGVGGQQIHGDYELFQSLVILLNNLEQLINNVAGRSEANFEDLRADNKQARGR